MARRAFARSMNAYVLAPLARAGIFDIWAHIAENSETAADRVDHAIYDACAFLADGPLRGDTRPDTAPLQIVAVLHGKRNLRRVIIPLDHLALSTRTIL